MFKSVWTEKGKYRRFDKLGTLFSYNRKGFFIVDNNNAERYLIWDGCYNIRDLGGFALANGGYTKWKVLIRADSIHKLTEKGYRQLLEYGVRSIIDLRTPTELDHSSSLPFFEKRMYDLHYINISLFSNIEHELPHLKLSPFFPLNIYQTLLHRSSHIIKRILHSIAHAPQGSVIIHCEAGRDRTGFIVALILSLFEVSPRLIATDYVMSNFFLQSYNKTTLKQDNSVKERETESHFISKASTIINLLQFINIHYGGTQDYMQNTACIKKSDLDLLAHRFCSFT